MVKTEAGREGDGGQDRQTDGCKKKKKREGTPK